MSGGIDYGRGLVNIDRETGIRYGVISQHNVAHWILDEAENIYPDKAEVTCPECEHAFETESTSGSDQQECPECEHMFYEHWLDEMDPIGLAFSDLERDGYSVEYSETLCCLFVVKSPFFTRGVFCSPCAPGAVDLDNPDDDGERGYCFGHDCFEDGKAPYRVWSVETGEEVLP